MPTPEEIKAQQDAETARLAEEKRKQDEAAATEDKDDKGVSYKNRFLENERKMNAIAEEKAALEERIKALEAKATPEPEPEENPEENWMTVTRGITRQELREERQAMALINKEINRFEKDEDYGDLVKQYRGEIEEQLDILTHDLRMKPSTVEKIVTMVLGAHLKELKSKFKPAGGGPLTKTPDSIATSSTGAPAGGGDYKDTLSPDEEKFAKARGYLDEDKDYTISEIKASFKKYLDKKKK